MFDNLKNMAGLMSQAKEMRAKMEQAQAELARKTVEADAGAGAVRVTMNGKMEVLSVRIDKAMIATLVGSGAERTLRLQPATGRRGTSLMTVTATDAGNRSARAQFVAMAFRKQWKRLLRRKVGFIQWLRS